MDQGQLTRYRNAILGNTPVSPSTAAPAATPELAPQFANLQKLGASNMGGQVARSVTNAFGGASQSIADQEEAAAKLRLQEEEEKAAALEKQKEDMLDPKKYRQEIDELGGYKFYDPQGSEIDVKQYSGVTGKHITDILKKSQNPEDQQFISDYKQIEKLGQIMQKGDKKALEKLYKEQPDLEKQIKGRKYNEIVRDFRRFYPKFFNETPVQEPKTVHGGKTAGELSGGGNVLGNLLSSLLGG